MTITEAVSRFTYENQKDAAKKVWKEFEPAIRKHIYL
jgi:hypothetical protein